MGSPVARGALLALLLASPVVAQQMSFEVDRLTAEDGLSSATAWQILQDHDGFIWIATPTGLNRYDGYEFEVYLNDPDLPGSLASGQVLGLHEDRQGELWIGTDSGLHRLDRRSDRFIAYRHDPSDPESLSHDRVWTLTEDASGSLWVGTDDGLNRFDRSTGRFTRIRSDPERPGSLLGKSVISLLPDPDGKLWVGTDQGLSRCDPESETCERFSKEAGGSTGSTVLRIQVDGDDTIWAATSDGLLRIDRSSRETIHYRHDPTDPSSLPTNSVTVLLVDSQGDLWVGTDDGLALLDRRTDSFVHYRHHSSDPRSLASNLITEVYEDRTGVLWIGTHAGIGRHDRRRQQFGTYRQQADREPTLSGRAVWAILQDRAGTVWLGTEGGLDRLDRERGSLVNYRPDPEDPHGLVAGVISTLFEDRAGVLWIGAWGGLSRMDRDTERFMTYRSDPSDPGALNSGLISVLYEDSSERLWVGTVDGLHRLDRANDRFVRYPTRPEEPATLADEPFFAIVEDRGGALWFGSDPALYRLRAGEFVEYRHRAGQRDGLGPGGVASLHVDDHNTLWVGMNQSGLSRLDSERRVFTHYRRRDGLPSDTVIGILGDERGHLWLSTTRGLSRFDPVAETFRNYDAGDGLQGTVFARVSSFRGASGELFFGGLNGFNAFFPDRIADDPQAPAVAITDIRLFNRSVPLQSQDPRSPLAQPIVETRELVLTHQDYVFGFEFAALHYANPRKNRFAYRLEGLDVDWIETDASQRFVQYSNLAPGAYDFRVKASNKDGVWSDQARSIEITVLPPPWRTWWAYAIYATAVAAIVSGYLRWQQRRVEQERALVAERTAQVEERERLLVERHQLIAELEARNAELARFNYTVAHDLKNPLTTIRNFIGLLEQDAAAGNRERLHTDLRRIDGAASKLHRLIEALHDFSRVNQAAMRYEDTAVGEVVAQALTELDPPLAERGIEVEVAADLPVVRADRARLLEVIRHLLDNAVRYMGDQPAPRIAIGVRDQEESDGGVPVFTIRDNGMGIEPRYHERVFELFEHLEPGTSEGTGIGLALAKRIVELHGGRIWVESEAGVGSTFCFTLS